jgi:predicted aspartyl protease
MMLGHIRQRFPRVLLSLPGQAGPLEIEFIVDTAFDGDLAVPSELALRLDAQPLGRRGLSLADGSLFVSGAVEIEMDLQGELRLTEVLILDGSPLLGVVLMEGFHLGADMEPGGEVSLEPL